MTSEEERFEVAESIRYYAKESDESAYEFIRGYWPNDIADFIDPTCHVDVNKHGRAYCTNCGCDDWCLADGSHFCPNCGARVVDDDN